MPKRKAHQAAADLFEDRGSPALAITPDIARIETQLRLGAKQLQEDVRAIRQAKVVSQEALKTEFNI